MDDFNFDSAAEARYYLELKLLKRSGQVKDFILQPRFLLQDAYTNKNGKKVRKTEYVADFLVTYADGKQEIIDVKGSKETLTAIYKLKKKWFESVWGLTIKEVFR